MNNIGKGLYVGSETEIGYLCVLVLDYRIHIITIHKTYYQYDLVGSIFYSVTQIDEGGKL